MFAKLAHHTSWVTFAGCLTLLAGLCIDQILHLQFPALALTEGVFSLTNPGHLLFGLGTGQVVISMELFLLDKAWQMKKNSLLTSGLLIMAAVWLIALCAVSLMLTLGSGTVSVQSHHSI